MLSLLGKSLSWSNPMRMVILLLLWSDVVRGSCFGKKLLRTGRISCEEKQIILDEHNRLRQLVALGHIRDQPAAANMMEMIWDDRLAVEAQRWAESCQEKHDTVYLRRWTESQNIARSYSRKPRDSEPDWRLHISSWFNEVYHYRSGYSESTGHYTQMVWSDSFRIGCGYAFYYDPAKGYIKNYVCNYAPGGNIIGSRPYQPGQPACSNYGMIYSNRYAGLCSPGNYYHLGALCVHD